MEQPSVIVILEGDDILSSKQDFEDFERSNLWADISNMMKERLSFVQRDLERAQDITVIHRLQQEAKDIRDFLEIPALMIHSLEQEERLENA